MRAGFATATIGVAVAMAACQFDASGLDDGDGGNAADAGPPLDGDQDPDALDRARTPLRVGDVRLAFGQISSGRVHTSTWSRASSAWRMADSTPMTIGNPVWTVNAVTPGPEAEELMVAQLAAVGGQAFAAFTWDEDAWRPDWTSTATLSQSGKRAFDLAVESSGDAMVVYATDSMTPAYRTRTGGEWSDAVKLPLNDGPGPLPDTNLGVVEWIELSSRRGGDEIALVFSDSNRDLVAMVWNGTAWVIASARTLETDLKQNALSQDVANRGFDTAIASSSAQVLVAWAQQSANGVLFNHWTPASGWLENADRATGIVAGYPHFIDLAANPQGNLIAGAFFDLGDGTERVGTAMWDGSTWNDRGELDSQSRDVNDQAPGDMPGAVAWIGTTGVAVCIYSDNQEGTLDWARWEAQRGWTLETDIAFAGKGFTESVAIASDPDSDRLVVALSDANLRLFAITYNGASWQLSNQGMPLTSVISNGTSVPFSVATRGQ